MTTSVQFQAGARAFKEGRHTNPYPKTPIRWHRDWQRGYDSEAAKATNLKKEFA